MFKFKNASSSSSANGSKSSAGCLIPFGLIFFAAGLVITYFISSMIVENYQTRSWDKVAAEIVSAEVKVDRSADEDPFSLGVRFRYSVDGREFTSDTYSRVGRTSDSYEKLALRVKTLLAEDSAVAYVNPKDPAEAFLNPGSVWFGLTILFPLSFVVIGGGLAYWGFRSLKKTKKENAGGTVSISSSPTSSSKGATIGIVLGLIFAVVGLGMLYPLGIRPVALAQSAKNWIETPCKILWGKVRSHDSDDGTTYSVDIFYAYEFEGQKHRSNRYSFIGGSSGGYKGKRAIVDKFKKAKNPVCYVDPKLPERAVLKREMGWGALLGLIPVVFLLVGAGIAFASFKARAKALVGQPAGGEPSSYVQPLVSTTSSTGPRSVAAGERVLSPGKKRILSVFGLLIVALFWNGLVFGLLFREAWLNDGELFLKLFSIPFMLVGIGIVAGFFYTLLALFNPKPVLTLSPGEVTLGENASLKWTLKGSTGRIQRFRILVKGVERATYTRGTNTVTDEETFSTAVLVEKTQAMEMHEGGFEFKIPHDLMYSFKATSNEILWKLEVRGDIPFWPDLSDAYDITVHPPANS
ncbi:MAG: DUF3592 domain-containing protein [Verrucomicrobiota bacterium]